MLNPLNEALEGGTPGQGATFLNGAADSTGNHGLIATPAPLSATQASGPPPRGS